MPSDLSREGEPIVCLAVYGSESFIRSLSAQLPGCWPVHSRKPGGADLGTCGFGWGTCASVGEWLSRRAHYDSRLQQSLPVGDARLSAPD